MSKHPPDMNMHKLFLYFFACSALISLSVFAAQDCNTCHTGTHEGAFKHSAMDQGCVICHIAHDPKKPELKLLAEVPALCINCHGEYSNIYRHAPAEAGACTECHNPHASSNPKLMKTAVVEKCGECHEAQKSGKHFAKTFAHPVKGAKDPLKKGSAFSCVSCHNPHAAAFKPLLIKKELAGAQSCLQCHTKVRSSTGR